MRRLSILLSLILFPLCATAAPGWVFEKVALSGETAPGTARTYTSFDNARDAGAEGAFGAMLSGAPLQLGTFRRDAGSVSAVSFAGDTAPGTGGGTYSILFPTPSRAGGVVSFPASVAGGTASNGIFIDDGTGDAAAVVFGAAAPGGGTLEPSLTDTLIHSVNASGEVAFRSALTGTTSTQGIFTSDGAGRLRERRARR